METNYSTPARKQGNENLDVAKRNIMALNKR
jgi:hypothetical protein